MRLRIRCVLSIFLITTFLSLAIAKTNTKANEKIAQAYMDFFSMELAPHEVGFMCLGVYSDVIVRIGEKTILFDPSILSNDDLQTLKANKLDLVTYTHEHGDHFDKQTALGLFQNSEPYIIIDPSMTPLLKKEIPEDKLIIAESGKSHSAGEITIDALAGKHIGPIMLYRISVSDTKILHAGDSAYVPLEAMSSDIAFVPTGHPSPTCSPKKAFKMVADVKPQFAVPFHGQTGEHNKFNKLVKKKLPDVSVVIPEPYVPRKLTVR